MQKANIKSTAYNNFRHILREFGYRSRESGIYTIFINDDFLGWVGIPSSKKGETVAVSPVIGIRHQPTHRLLSQILEEDFHEYLPPTASIGLGFLLPDARWREWYFDASDDLSSYRYVGDLIQVSGSRFFERAASIDSVIALFETFDYVRLKMDAFERLPILKFLNGNIKEAVATLDMFVSKTAENSDPRSINYRTKYAENFRKMVYGTQ